MAELFRSGFVAIAGAPNVGKSTLLNRLLGQKLAITSPKPQTTRNRITGVVNVPGAQLTFVDTPGIHEAQGRLNRNLVRMALDAVRESDALLLMADVHARAIEEAALAVRALARETRKPVVLAINKIDLVAKPLLLPIIDRYRKLMDFAAVVPISALKGDGVDALLMELARLLPEGAPLFPEDYLTDQPERFLAAEIVREKIFHLTHRELPYASAVEVESWEEEEGLVTIHAVIYVEREGQKAIIIGRGGQMLKEIGQRARTDIERLLGTRVMLRLWVKVRPEWRRDPRALRELGLEPTKK
jgi:GTP-binding protein Era